MKDKIKNVFKTICAFIKEHSLVSCIGTCVAALLVTVIIVVLACKDMSEQAPAKQQTTSKTTVSYAVKETSSTHSTQKKHEDSASSQKDEGSNVVASKDTEKEANEQKEKEEQPLKVETVSQVTSSPVATSSQTSSNDKYTVPVTTIEEPKVDKVESNPASSGSVSTYKENQKKHENKVESYLEKHDIDPDTAGETGEKCPHCGKKIWNPNKYGLNNPGYPDDYENSGYCTGWCAVQVG